MPPITGTDGDDTLNGTSGDDVIFGGAGNDILSGGDGNDTLAGGPGDDTLDGGAGLDTADYSDAQEGVYVAVANSNPQNTGEGRDTLTSIENLTGSSHNDMLFGGDGANAISGGDGDDVITGGGGVDHLDGGAGNDVYVFDYADEHSDGEISDSGGYDTVRFGGSAPGTLTLFAGDTGIDRVQIAAGMQLVEYGGERIDGTNIDASAVLNALVIDGNAGTNILTGTAFADTISGYGGDDHLIGGDGNDSLNGGQDDDQLTGGAGLDLLAGGDGSDTFVDTAAGLNGDTISDFSVGDSILITDAALSGFTFNLVGNTLNYTGGSLTLATPFVGTLVATAAAGGGVQLTIGPSLFSPVPASPGPVNTDAIYGGDDSTDPYPDYVVAAGSYLHMQTTSENTLFPWGVASLTNAGTIYFDTAPGFSGDIRFSPGNSPILSFNNSGTIVLDNHTDLAGGVIALEDVGDGNPDSIVNSGQIYLVSDHFDATFLLTWQPSSTFTNSGPLGVYAPLGTGVALQFVNGVTSIDNEASGQILVEGNNVTAIEVGLGGDTPQITNAGLIEARSVSDLPSFGIYSSFAYVVNSGTITADVAVSMDGVLTNSGTINGVVDSGTELTFNNEAGGILNGDLLGADGWSQNVHDSINNAGVINGDVLLYNGDDIVINSGAGQIEGVVYLGFGNDSYTGSSAVDRVGGDEGNDTLDGGAGNDLLMGGSGDDSLSGGAGNDGLYGEHGNDVIFTSGGDVVVGGDGDDRVQLGDYSFREVSGGDGTDTLALAPGALTLDLSAALASGRINGFEIVELSANQGLVIRSGDVEALSGGSSLRIDAVAGDTVTLVGAWTHVADTTVAGSIYKEWMLNGATVLVEAGATTVTSTVAPATAAGLSAIAAGGAPLTPGVDLDYSPDRFQVSDYDVGAITIDTGETWYSLGAEPVFRTMGYGGFLTVDGTVDANDQFGAQALAVEFWRDYGLGTIVNNGTISAESNGPPSTPSASLSEGAVAISGGIQLTNAGDINASSSLGVAFAVGRVTVSPTPELISSIAEVDNSGEIRASAASSYAFAIAASTRVTNSGIIEADGFQGSVAVAATNFVHNLVGGQIIATSAGQSTAIRIDDAGHQTNEVTNAGTIIGDVAIDVVNAPHGFWLTNSGTIEGDVQTAATLVQNDLLTNTGLIDGNVSLGGGDDIFDGSLGVQTGLIFGAEGNDHLVGGASNDMLSGGSGIDILTGGAGSDTFRDTAAGLSGDRITDFGAGDRIVFSDADLTTFTFSVSGTTLNFSGGSLTLGSVPGKIIAEAAPEGGVQLELAPIAHNDFSGDAKSDFLLLDSNSGWLTDWLGASDGSFTNNGANASIHYSSDWHVVGTGDVNGDGSVDYLLRSDAGWTTDWLGTASGGFTNNGANASILFASNWQIAGTGDFNGDGHTDFLLRDTTGGWLTEWIGNANGGFTNNGANSTEYFSSDWHVIGTGDFNGDGTSDFLLRSDAGWVTDWLGTSTGGFTNNGANASLYFSSDWHVIGTGDFNGDGISDILLRSDAGWVTDWLGNSSGGFTNNGANASILFSSDWKIASIGDFNGDGHDDLLLRNDNGWTTDWLGTASGGFTNNGSHFSTYIAPEWHVQDPFL